MSNLGMGAMLHTLSGGSPKSAQDYYGKVIKTAVFNKGADDVRITFEDGVAIRIWDSEQSCCENRYMTCDDSLSDLNGKTLAEINVKPGSETRDDDDNGLWFARDNIDLALKELETTNG